MHIAMWSGPRNLSTAMMYAFGARSDCAIWDEPYYAAYLAASDIEHPLRAEIVAAGEVDPARVAARCIGVIPDASAVFYQKHMTHHMLPEFSREWLREATNVFLIRDPAKVIASYHAKRENPVLADIGIQQQAEIFDQIVKDTGTAPVVIDSDDILANPEVMLRKLCDAIGLTFQDSMLHWPAGGHKDDGAWAPHWYKSVWQSTGFSAPNPVQPKADPQSRELLQAAYPFYERLFAHRITVG